MRLPPLRDGAPQKGQPDQPEGRDLIRPGEGPVQDVAAEHPRADTHHLQEDGQDGRCLHAGGQERAEAGPARGGPWPGGAAPSPGAGGSSLVSVTYAPSASVPDHTPTGWPA